MSEIVIENLYKSFDTKDGKVEALKNVNLSIESGDIYGIIGMSGAGKSTLHWYDASISLKCRQRDVSLLMESH